VRGEISKKRVEPGLMPPLEKVFFGGRHRKETVNTIKKVVVLFEPRPDVEEEKRGSQDWGAGERGVIPR